MTTKHHDLAGCYDCPATVTSTRGTSATTRGPVLIVTVEHAASCPAWRLKLDGCPERQTIAPTPDRLLRHVVAEG